jgi:hypothetical protein
MSSRKIYFHPDKEEIARMMLNGISVQRIEKWLIEKYPDKKEYWISIPTLQGFRKDGLKLDKEALHKIKNEAASKVQDKRDRAIKDADDEDAIIQSIFAVSDPTENIIKPIAQSSATYREKIGSVSELNIDVTRKIVELDALITSRMEYYFNRANEGEDPESNIKYDRVLVEYIKQQGELYRDWKRLIEGLAEQNVDTSVHLEIVQEHVSIIRDTVRELLNDIDPSLALVFLERLTEKLNAIEYRHQTIDIPAQAKKLDKQIIEVKQDIEKDTKSEGSKNE